MRGARESAVHVNENQAPMCAKEVVAHQLAHARR